MIDPQPWCPSCDGKAVNRHPRLLSVPPGMACPSRICAGNYALKRCRINDETGCWEWTLSTSKFGHGRAKYLGKLYLPHRMVAYALGTISAMESEQQTECVLHKCDNPRCCNPEHLFIGSMADNAHDAIAKGRHHLPR